MRVHISPDQKAFIREAIESGRFRKEEDALQEALALWEERERVRAEILAAVAKAEDSIARGEGRIITRASVRGAGPRSQTTRSCARFTETEFRHPLMVRHRLSPEAEAELDEIWFHNTSSDNCPQLSRFFPASCWYRKSADIPEASELINGLL